MTTDEIRIFEKEEDHKNWDKLIQHCDLLEYLTVYEKESAKKSLQFLKEELGVNFLQDVDKQHVLTQHLWNLAPWTRKWLTFFADMLKEVKKYENYQSLLKRLKDNKQSDEALTVLEPAYKFSKEGFKIFFDPPINSFKKSSYPDLKIENEGSKEILFVEVSKHQESIRQKKAMKTFERIIESLWRFNPSIRYCGKIYKSLAERHLDDISKKVIKAIEKVNQCNTFQELVIKDVIEIGIAPEKDIELLQKWAAEKGFKVGEFSGPPIDVDELQRIRLKIEKEKKQLPSNYPNIVIVTNTSLFFPKIDIEKLISELEEEAYTYSNILFLVICGKHFGASLGEIGVLQKDDHVFIRKIRTDFQVEQYLILLNKYCDFNVSQTTLSKIYDSFINN